jgi:hypothetical protein
MSEECKIVISLRVPPELLRRIAFFAGNTDRDALATRSAVILAAVEAWLPAQEQALREHLKSVGAPSVQRK